MKTLLCDCNRTMHPDAPTLRRALEKTPGASTDGLETVHTLLCRREAGAFQRAAKETAASGDELLVACTQEATLFTELNAQTEGAVGTHERPIHFVNIRETGGWSKDGAQATPKMAALIAAAQLPPPAPVPVVTYRSAGRCLVLGPPARAEAAAALLADTLTVTLLVEGTGGTLGQDRPHAVHTGRLTALTGWLGAFEARWETTEPIDLDLCTRCNACVEACPEGAIDFSYRIDLARCAGHRECVRVCDAAGAIDFHRAPQATQETFDLVLDLRPQPAFTMHQPPQGYHHAGGDEAALLRAVLELRAQVGEFEKPKFFQYNPKLCAHSRNEVVGCRACIDVCSAQAIRSEASLKGKAPGRHGARGPGATFTAPAGGVVAVEPHLCVGCGACSTVCPSGAMSFAYPGPVDQGRRLKTLLSAYANAGGQDAVLLLHSEGAGARRIESLARAARRDRTLRGVPARVIPVPVWHTASLGIELWLAAIAQGANQVWVMLTDEEAPDYRRALAAEMATAQAILTGLGYAGRHLRLVDASAAVGDAALDAALREAPARGVARPATFAAQAAKRGTLDLALDHLVAQAPATPLPEAVGLPPGPLGSLLVDPGRCTMCLSCVGACPEAALADNPERPQLRFIEKNCVQCGLCATTCPEDAITLQPRLWLAEGGRARKQARVLHEVEPFHCVRCAKPFGTLRAIESMMAKLAGHAAFQGAAADRLKMCGDCRVVDMFENRSEVKITDLR